MGARDVAAQCCGVRKTAGRDTPCRSRAVVKALGLFKRSDKIVGFHDATAYTTRDATQFRNAWAPHTQTQRHGVLAMVIRPYKPRDSARSALLDCST